MIVTCSILTHKRWHVTGLGTTHLCSNYDHQELPATFTCRRTLLVHQSLLHHGCRILWGHRGDRTTPHLCIMGRDSEAMHHHPYGRPQAWHKGRRSSTTWATGSPPEITQRSHVPDHQGSRSPNRHRFQGRFYTVSQKKGCHPNHGYNFVNSWSICKILSLLQRAVNFQQKSY